MTRGKKIVNEGAQKKNNFIYFFPIPLRKNQKRQWIALPELFMFSRLGVCVCFSRMRNSKTR